MSARLAAYECILAVESEDAYANLALPTIIAEQRLDGRDAGLATELAYGTLRMRGLYDAVIGKAARRDPASLELPVRIVLWLGVHQVLAMRIPAHAAVDESVRLVRLVHAERAAGFVNAVTRRVTEASAEAWLARVAPGSSRHDLAVRHSHPEWIVGELERSMQADSRPNQVESLLASHNDPAKVTLVARPGLIGRDALAAQVNGQPTPLSPYGVVLDSGDPGALDAVKAGTAAVQDEGSQLAALALAHASVADDQGRWLDMCAGPGGKAALLGGMAMERGAHVDALELHDHRAGLVKRAIAALPDGVVRVHTADATVWEGGPYDRILVDAPCTGLGALRRRPEARWRRTAADLAELTALQARLLGQAKRLLRPGGVIAYVTCSPVLAETRDIVADSGVVMIDAREALAAATGVTGRWGDHFGVQLWTDRHGTDSMFISLVTDA